MTSQQTNSRRRQKHPGPWLACGSKTKEMVTMISAARKLRPGGDGDGEWKRIVFDAISAELERLADDEVYPEALREEWHQFIGDARAAVVAHSSSGGDA